jgi:uncharacterized protein (TIGR03086 family)
MTETPLGLFDQASAALETVLAEVKPAQLDEPTPCPEWSVRQLVNHVVTGNLTFAGMITGSGPADGSQDHLGEDPLKAFQTTVADLRAEFAADGALQRTFQTPMGERPGTRLVTTRIIEMSLHGWDLAKATGQTIELSAEVAEHALGTLRMMLSGERTADGPFGVEQPASPTASPADQVAAFAGRSVE